MVDGSRVIGITTQDGRIHCDNVVLAAGAWSSILAQQAGIISAPPAGAPYSNRGHPTSHPRHPWCWIDDAGIYVRPEAGGWLCSPCDETPERSPSPDSRGPVSPQMLGLVHEKIRRFFPSLSQLDVRGGWSGLRTFAPDRRPLMGPDPDLDGLWWAAGLGGYGVSCSPAIGESMAAWLTGKEVAWLEPSWVDPGRTPLQRWSIRPDGDHHGTVLIDA